MKQYRIDELKAISNNGHFRHRTVCVCKNYFEALKIYRRRKKITKKKLKNFLFRNRYDFIIVLLGVEEKNDVDTKTTCNWFCWKIIKKNHNKEKITVSRINKN